MRALAFKFIGLRISYTFKIIEDLKLFVLLGYIYWYVCIISKTQKLKQNVSYLK